MAQTTKFSSIVPRKIRVIGVPLDLGQSRRGVDMGPSAVRVAGLEARLEAIGHNVEDGGNVAVAFPEQKKEGKYEHEAEYWNPIAVRVTWSNWLWRSTRRSSHRRRGQRGDWRCQRGAAARPSAARSHRGRSLRALRRFERRSRGQLW